jgi:hypothetical protein
MESMAQTQIIARHAHSPCRDSFFLFICFSFFFSFSFWVALKSSSACRLLWTYGRAIAHFLKWRVLRYGAHRGWHELTQTA